VVALVNSRLFGGHGEVAAAASGGGHIAAPPAASQGPQPGTQLGMGLPPPAAGNGPEEQAKEEAMFARQRVLAGQPSSAGKGASAAALAASGHGACLAKGCSQAQSEEAEARAGAWEKTASSMKATMDEMT
jgi:hypothetical protein